jgi:hypothetical protein
MGKRFDQLFNTNSGVISWVMGKIHTIYGTAEATTESLLSLKNSIEDIKFLSESIKAGDGECSTAQTQQYGETLEKVLNDIPQASFNIVARFIDYSSAEVKTMKFYADLLNIVKAECSAYAHGTHDDDAFPLGSYKNEQINILLSKKNPNIRKQYEGSTETDKANFLATESANVISLVIKDMLSPEENKYDHITKIHFSCAQPVFDDVVGTLRTIGDVEGINM